MTHNPGGVRRDAEKAVRAHFVSKMDKEVHNAFSVAMWDLHYGPGCGGTEMGYTTALKLLRDWSSEELSDVWYDVQCGEVLEAEPQSWEDEDGNMVEPCMEDYIEFDVQAGRRLLFGALISNGGM